MNIIIFIFWRRFALLISFLNGNMNFFNAVVYILSALVVIFLTLPFHEFAHAYIADKLGDKTARYQGRLTMNPMAHIDYLGAIGILFLGFGWARPVPVNANNFKNPKRGMALTAFAGPAMNIIVAFVARFIVYALLAFNRNSAENLIFYIAIFFGYYSMLNINIAVFNLLPIPPLDGSRLLTVFLPTKYYFAVMRYERYISLFIILLIWIGVLDAPLSFLSNWLVNVLDILPRIIFGY